MSDLPWILAGYGLTLGSLAAYAVVLARRLRRERRR